MRDLLEQTRRIRLDARLTLLIQVSAMRILGLALSLLVTLSISAAAQTAARSRPSPDQSPHKAYGYVDAKADTGRTAARNPDTYLQRYYSHSEGWTYYNLPPDSSAWRSGDR
jgi:hypothetical protein